ncbi:hypothetical protein ANTRET_LOCUS3324 [Anthophora retusa]
MTLELWPRLTYASFKILDLWILKSINFSRLLRGDCANVVFESVRAAVVNNFLRVTLENFEGYTGIITKEFLNLEDASCTMNEPDPCLPLILPPRYRLRDLILGDYAFNDDGER